MASQPPSGGCVLKLMGCQSSMPLSLPAAFGRLCVETFRSFGNALSCLPAAFGRLCVETGDNTGKVANPHSQPPSGGCVLKPFASCGISSVCRPAAFGRLCVETSPLPRSCQPIRPAAFGRLCVETMCV